MRIPNNGLTWHQTAKPNAQRATETLAEGIALVLRDSRLASATPFGCWVTVNPVPRGSLANGQAARFTGRSIRDAETPRHGFAFRGI
jgi:hypothetical protein